MCVSAPKTSTNQSARLRAENTFPHKLSFLSLCASKTHTQVQQNKIMRLGHNPTGKQQVHAKHCFSESPRRRSQEHCGSAAKVVTRGEDAAPQKNSACIHVVHGQARRMLFPAAPATACPRTTHTCRIACSSSAIRQRTWPARNSASPLLKVLDGQPVRPL